MRGRMKGKGRRCASCSLSFRDDDLIELDHIVPPAAGDLHAGLNQQALHRHCHDRKTRDDESRAPTDARYPVTRDHSTEELASGKLLCPVLETNGTGRLVVQFKQSGPVATQLPSGDRSYHCHHRLDVSRLCEAARTRLR
jgi:HNH endonuclease